MNKTTSCYKTCKVTLTPMIEPVLKVYAMCVLLIMQEHSHVMNI